MSNLDAERFMQIWNTMSETEQRELLKKLTDEGLVGGEDLKQLMQYIGSGRLVLEKTKKKKSSFKLWISSIAGVILEFIFVNAMWIGFAIAENFKDDPALHTIICILGFVPITIQLLYLGISYLARKLKEIMSPWN